MLVTGKDWGVLRNYTSTRGSPCIVSKYTSVSEMDECEGSILLPYGYSLVVVRGLAARACLTDMSEGTAAVAALLVMRAWLGRDGA